MITAMPRIAIAHSDFDAMIDTFRNAFGMPVVDLSGTSVESLGARLGMCVPPGGSNIELMSPADPGAPLSQSLQRFLDRRGPGLFALMLEAASPDDEAERLAANGLSVLPLMAGAGGRDVHPKSTQGVLIRIYPTGSFHGSAPAPAAALGLSGIRRVQVAVRDLDHAAGTWAGKLGLASEPAVDDDARGVSYVRCQPPAGGVIELIAVRDRTMRFAAQLSAHLEARGEGLYALVLSAPDREAARSSLAGRGVAFSSDFSAAVFGARVQLEQS